MADEGTTARDRDRLNLWVICAAQFIPMAGMTAVLPLLPLYLQRIGVEDPAALRYWTGALGAAPFAVGVIATPLWGALADRIGYKPMVVRSVAGISVAVFGMGLATTPLALLGCRALQGAVSGVFPAAVALLAAITPEAQLGRSMALLQSARQAGALSGPLIGGALADLVGMRPLFFGGATLSAITAVVCALVLHEPPRPPRAADRTRDATGALAASNAPAASDSTWRRLLADPATMAMLGLVVLFQVTIMASWPSMALFVEQIGVEGHALATVTGAVIFAAGFPAMLTAPSWARLTRSFGLEPVIVASVTLTGFASIAVGLWSRHIAQLIVLRVLFGLAMAGFTPLSFQWITTRGPASMRGRAAGLASTAMMAGNVIGPLLGGWLAVHVGLAATFWLPGVLLATAGIALGVLRRSST